MYEIYLSIVAFYLGAFVMFTFIAISASIKEDKTNKVNFYVVRDKNNTLWLFLRKPIKVYDDVWTACKGGYSICAEHSFENIGLKEADYKDLKWEDEPKEVFLNLED